MNAQPKQCPECLKVFVNKHNGWSGIDGHWRANHDHIVAYSRDFFATVIKPGKYRR